MNRAEKQEIERVARKNIGNYPVFAWYDNKRKHWFIKPNKVSKVKKMGKSAGETIHMIIENKRLDDVKEYLTKKGYIINSKFKNNSKDSYTLFYDRMHAPLIYQSGMSFDLRKDEIDRLMMMNPDEGGVDVVQVRSGSTRICEGYMSKRDIIINQIVTEQSNDNAVFIRNDDNELILKKKHPLGDHFEDFHVFSISITQNNRLKIRFNTG